MKVTNPADVRNPDDLWLHPGARSFYYVPKTDHLTIGKAWYERHQDLIGHPDLSSQFPTVEEPNNMNTMQFALQGRVGYAEDGRQLVSFWNAKQHEQGVAGALKRLQQDGHIGPSALVVGKGLQPKEVADITGIKQDTTQTQQNMTQAPQSPFQPDMETRPDEEIGGTPPFSHVNDPRRISPEDQQLWQQMHLMHPDEKRAAMRHLGVGGGGTPHPWQAGMQSAGMIGPGQRWWAPTSESYSFKEWLKRRQFGER
jgi:hypothetical protein